MSDKQASKKTAIQQPKAAEVKRRKTVTLPTKDEEARQENEGGPPVKHIKTA